MEKSIENIWKQGFLKPEALVAPRLNNLYEQKSKHIIDKFNRMFRINLKAIVIGSVLVLGISFLAGIPVMGALLFVLANTIVLVNRRLQKELPTIDVMTSSYEYLTAFDEWLEKQLALNAKLARVYYPLIFLSVVLGLWFSSDFQKVKEGLDQYYSLFGVPVVLLVGLVVIVILLAWFGGAIYRWDVKLLYGKVFRKLDELITDMEDLRA